MHPDGRVQRLRPAIGAGRAARCARPGRCSPRSRRAGSTSASPPARWSPSSSSTPCRLRRADARRDRRPRRALARERPAVDGPGSPSSCACPTPRRGGAAPRHLPHAVGGQGGRRLARPALRAAPTRSSSSPPPTPSASASRHGEEVEVVSERPHAARPRRRARRPCRPGQRLRARGRRRRSPANLHHRRDGRGPRHRASCVGAPAAVGASGAAGRRRPSGDMPHGAGSARTPAASAPTRRCAGRGRRRTCESSSPRSATTRPGGSRSSRRWSSSSSSCRSCRSCIVAERKLLGRFQHRYGPNRVGPFGLLQPLAEILKFATKEPMQPKTAVGFLFALRAGHLDRHRGRGASPSSRSRTPSTSSARRSASTASTRTSGSSTPSPSARSPSTG